MLDAGGGAAVVEAGDAAVGVVQDGVGVGAHLARLAQGVGVVRDRRAVGGSRLKLRSCRNVDQTPTVLGHHSAR